MSWFKYGINSLWLKDLGEKYLRICIFDGADRYLVEDEIGKNDFTRLVIAAGSVSDLNFLAEKIIGGPKKLLILGGVKSLDGIHRLTNLVDFYCDLEMGKPFPNFRTLVKLENCILAWSKKYDVRGYDHGLFSLPALKSLTLRYWTQQACSEFAKIGKLEKLDLRQGGGRRLMAWSYVRTSRNCHWHICRN